MSSSSKTKKAAPGRTASQNKHPNHTAIDSHSQRQRLLARLRKGRITTLEARKELDILHPAARVQELREKGYRIDTHWQNDVTDCGQAHRVASYVLLGEARI